MKLSVQYMSFRYGPLGGNKVSYLTITLTLTLYPITLTLTLTLNSNAKPSVYLVSVCVFVSPICSAHADAKGIMQLIRQV